ncbi:hypothetical protein F5X68DRAFT_245280 [Plectosphaerella plurivora]|uniref:Transcription factor domain-containing protein n=1 Tax=Plectosphaerella plurivora TaxID=936078 RepID=A0A9P8V690_9PEZI|nr:hypothetical protein F5X68DRAFT_245280 [Plectosphaerella plurivora]
MQRVVNGRVELSTLQTFCILALLDFDAGRQERSRMLCSLAASLAGSSKLHLDTPGPLWMREERRRCYWAIALLSNLSGGITSPSPVAPPFPRNPQDPALIPQLRPSPSDGSFKAMEVVLKVSDVWSKAQTYVKACATPAAKKRPFPWEPDSNFCTTTTSFMGLGARLPLSHRYRSMDISQMTHEMLETNRSFWGPWLMSRLMYHTIACLLNHPLLLTLQIGDAHNVTEAFLHQTSHSITNHVSWSIHFIQLMRSRDFVPSDPVVVYCAAVVATIELQRSLSRPKSSEALRRKSQSNYDECLGLIRTLQTKWSYARRVAQLLDNLAADMSSWANSEPLGTEESITVDLTRILDILDFEMRFQELAMDKSRVTRGSTPPSSIRLHKMTRE